jgi:DNA-binding ferritin-like protein
MEEDFEKIFENAKKHGSRLIELKNREEKESDNGIKNEIKKMIKELEKDKIFLLAEIKRAEDGGWKLYIRVLEAYDGFTEKIFVEEVNEYGEKFMRVREANNGVYKNIQENQDAEQFFISYYNSYKEAMENLKNIIKEIKENREKVRNADGFEEKFYLLV